MSAGPGRREALLRAIERREQAGVVLRWQMFAIFALGVLLIDQITKAIIRGTLAPRESREVFPGFDISHFTNDGIAFGLFPGRQTLVAVLTVVALCAIAIALASIVHRNVVVAVGAGLLVGGSLGNLTDRVLRGGVTDFLDPVRWPAFNVADMGIVCGAALIVVGLMAVGERDDGQPA